MFEAQPASDQHIFDAIRYLDPDYSSALGQSSELDYRKTLDGWIMVILLLSGVVAFFVVAFLQVR